MSGPMPVPNLLVIRSRHLDRAARFYEALGMTFDRHAHGRGPEHLVCELDRFVFEIYPLTDDQASTTGVRFGFRVREIDRLVKRLPELGGRIVTPSRVSEWGRRAVVEDPDGHRIELIKDP